MFHGIPSRLSLGIVIIVFGIDGWGGAWSKEDTTASPWQDTGLDLSFFRQNVTTDSCRRSETEFLACVAAVQATLDHHGKGLRLVPSNDTRRDRSATRPYKRFGLVKIVRTHDHESTDLAKLLQEARERRARLQAWRDFHQKHARAPIPFSAIRDWILSDVVDQGRLADYAAVAINGYISTADAHARIIPAHDLYRKTKTSKETYSGIGILLRPFGGAVTVGEVIRDGPAFHAGLRPNDLILSVDGEAVAGRSVEDITARLKGPEGTRVLLKVKRRDRELDIAIRREQVQIKSAASSVIPDHGKRWGYLRIESFMGSDTCREVQRELRRLLVRRVTGIVLDLRDNMGGLIDQAVCVADLFLAPGRTVLKMRPVAAGERSRVLRTRRPGFTRLPLITLVNSGTGSASEVLAGALQDHKRSFLIGERTFGKGTIQTAKAWNRSGSVLQLFTAARFFLPSGRTIQLVGVEPDFMALDSPDLREEQLLALREEDLFPTALPPVGRSWAQPRPGQVTALARCVKARELPEQASATRMRSREDPDYPLYFAQHALSCMYRSGTG